MKKRLESLKIYNYGEVMLCTALFSVKFCTIQRWDMGLLPCEY